MLRIDMEYSRKYIHILLAVLSSSASQQFSAQAFQPSLFVKTQRNEIHSRKMFFDFHDDPIVIPDEKYDSVLDWAFESTPPLAIRKSQLGHGHGLFATQGINADSIVFKIPREKCLTLQEAKSHPTLGKSLAIMEDDLGEEFGPIAILSAYLASEMLREDCAEWEEDESLRGEYGPYVSILPTGRAVSEQDHVLWWSEKEVNDLFKGGAAHDKATALRDWADMEGSIIQGMLVTDLAEKNMGLSISQVRGSVTNSFVNVLSRSLFVGESGKQRLVPILDMCAHAQNPNLNYTIDEKEDIIVTATKSIASGEELTAQYYSTEFEGHEFYVMYGFVVPFANPVKSQ